jgi:hypothetical protein
MMFSSSTSKFIPLARWATKAVSEGNIPSFGPPGTSDNEVWRKHLKKAFGTASDSFVEVSLRQLQFAARMPGDGALEVAINAAIAMIAAAEPANKIEAALAVQMACTHMVAMVMFARIGGGHGGPHRLPGLGSTAAKLLRAYCTQLETLRRLRGGGEQKIIVKHVTVNEGGQAIVGSVNSRA